MEGYLPDQYVFVYLRTRSELLRDPDHAYGSFERIKFGPFEEEQSRSCSLYNCCTLSWFNEWLSFFSTKKWHRSKFASGVLPTVPRWKHSSIDDGLLGTALLFSSVRCDFDSQRYLIKRALQNQSSLRLIPFSSVNSDSCRQKLDLHKFIAFVRELSSRWLI